MRGLRSGVVFMTDFEYDSRVGRVESTLSTLGNQCPTKHLNVYLYHSRSITCTSYYDNGEQKFMLGPQKCQERSI